MSKEVEVIDVDEEASSLYTILAEVLSAETEENDTEESNDNIDESTDKETIEESSENNKEREIKGILTSKEERKPEYDTKTEEPVKRETLFFFEVNDDTYSTPFRPEDPTNSDKDFPLKASGQIDNIFIVTSDNTYQITLIIDGDKVLNNEKWIDIETLSQELAHIEAYQRTDDNRYVLSISDYPFNEEVDLSIRPTGSTKFDVIRTEIMVDEYTRGGPDGK